MGMKATFCTNATTTVSPMAKAYGEKIPVFFKTSNTWRKEKTTTTNVTQRYNCRHEDRKKNFS